MKKEKILLNSVLFLLCAGLVYAAPAFYHTLSEIYENDEGLSLDADGDGVQDFLTVAGAIDSGSTVTAVGDITTQGAIVATGGISSQGSICDITGCILPPDNDWVESNGNIVQETANIGIGLTNPARKLQVLGDASIGQHANLGEDVFGEWLEIDGGGVVEEDDTCHATFTEFTECETDRDEVCYDIWQDDVNYFARDVTCVAATSGLTVDDTTVTLQNRDLGIGKAIPIRALDVVGEGYITGGSNALQVYGSNYGLFAENTDTGNDIKLASATRSFDARIPSTAGNIGGYLEMGTDIIEVRLAQRTDTDVYYGVRAHLYKSGQQNMAGQFKLINNAGGETKAYSYLGYHDDNPNEYYGIRAACDDNNCYGGYFSCSGTGCSNTNADLAEVFKKEGSEQIEKGDVVSISANSDIKLVKSNVPYDKTVAGVYSTSPALLIRPVTGNDEQPGIGIAGNKEKYAAEDEVPLAISGQVIVKVSDENGPINRGDFLTTSSTPGHAMLCDDFDKCRGAIIGKSMGILNSGTGTVVMLIMLA